MVARSVVLAGMVSLATLAFESAPAQESAAGFPQHAALSGVRFGETDERPALDITLTDERAPRFSDGAATRAEVSRRDDTIGYEFTVSASRERTGLLVDLALAQRTNIAVDENGDIGRAGAGVELRIGRNLERIARPWIAPNSDQGVWYMFAASDGQALTWTPGSVAGVSQGLHLQDRVTIGDAQVGLTYERGRFQTSFAYTQREVNYRRFTSESYSEDENFAGLVLTWRR